MEKYVDSVHGAVDHAGPVHCGPAAIVACPSLAFGRSGCRGCQMRGRGGKGEHGGSGFGLTGARKAAEQWRIGGEGSGRESSSAGRSGLRNGARRSEGGAMGGGDTGAPFYRVRGGAGRPGI
jgi:hypothetical protein